MTKNLDFACPHCGFPVKANANACKECGSDIKTGWNPDMPADASFLPPDEEDYQDNLRIEFGEQPNNPKMPNWIAITGFLLLVLLLIMFAVRASG